MTKKKPSKKAPALPVETLDGAVTLMQEQARPFVEQAANAGSSLTLYGVNPYELAMPETITEADYLAYGVNIGRAMEFASWRIGDWVNVGLVKFSYKDYTKLAGVTGLSEQYLRACSSVSGRVVPQLRATVSMERARLMLSKKNEKESVEHCFKRLAPKTNEQIRTLTSGGGHSKKKEPMTIDEFVTTCGDLLKFAQSLNADKYPILASATKDNNVLLALKDELAILMEAMADTIAQQAQK